MKKAIKLRLYPNKKQQELIEKTFGCCRFIYNKMLAERIDVYNKLKDSKELLRNYKYKTEKQYKEEYEFLKEISAQALQQTRIDLLQAYKKFFTKQNKFPKFKSKRNPKRSYREPQYIRKPQTSNRIRFENNKLHLLKLGNIRTRGYNGQEYTNINNVTVKKYNDKYYAIMNVDFEPKKLEKNNKVIGIDLGLKSFITDSNGKKVEYPQFYRQYEEKLQREGRWLSRKKKFSNNWNKQKKRLANVYEKVSNCRSHFLHNVSSQAINDNQVIACEDLNIKGMVQNRHLAKSILDSSFAEFIRQLEYKANWYGRKVVKVDRWFPSSKLCSNCGNKKDKLELSERTYKCDKCGFEIDRDYNASLNILNEGLRILVSNQEFTPVENRQWSFDETGTSCKKR